MRNIIALFALILMVSCEAIEDRDTLQNSFDLETIELKATQVTPGSNKIKLSVSDPTVTGYWNYTIGSSLNNEVEFNYSFFRNSRIYL